MKNALKYYYSLDVLNIHQKDTTFYFKYNSYEYVFTKCDLVDIDKIYKLSNNLNQNGVPSHEIILNNNNNILTNINNENYILMKMYVEKNQIEINDIINFNNIGYFDIKNLKMDNWYNLWTNKVDWFEYQISQNGKKYPLIRKSFSYYIGLSETAISLLKSVTNNNLYYSLNHRRINYKDNLQDLYNPLNFVIDLRIRDICEYFKNKFFYGEKIETEIFNYLESNNLDYNESIYFFARMLFPTYYFDIYEKIVNDSLDEININNILILENDYEIFIKKLYFYLKNKVNLPSIEWLIS